MFGQGTWNREARSNSGTFSGTSVGVFEIIVELDFDTTITADNIFGSTNNDYINSKEGEDTIDSRSGNDFITGGADDDVINGGTG